MKHLLRKFLSLASLTLVGLTAPGCANRDAPEHPAGFSSSDDESLMLIGVNGMVCNFCATNIDQSLARLPGVKKVHVHLASRRVLLSVAAGNPPSESAIRACVGKSGFEVRSFERKTGDFETVRGDMKAGLSGE